MRDSIDIQKMEGRFVDIKKFEAYKKIASNEIKNEIKSVNGGIAELNNTVLVLRKDIVDSEIKWKEEIQKYLLTADFKKRFEDAIRVPEFNNYKSRVED